MTWINLSHVLRRRRIAPNPSEALVVLLHDLGASGAALAPIAARWAATVPTTAIIALDGIEHLDAPRDGLASPAMLDRAAQNLEVLLGNQLHARRLDGGRLVLVGFGYGGTLALHLFLRRGWSCAGILAFAAQLATPLPRVLRIDSKVRLIDCGADARTDHDRLRDKLALLNARGIDTRGVLLSGLPLSDEAVRHGAAYLVELVATAERSGPFHIVRERQDIGRRA